MPDFLYESRLYDAGHAHVCGVDEAGRGPLAGPVVACAVILDPHQIPDGLNDSKALSQAARERLLNELKLCAKIGLGIAEPIEIERKNILWASMSAMERAVANLPKTDASSLFALIDGNRVPPGLTKQAEAIVKGDAKSLSIAAASIVAKVVRDRLMGEACTRFPGYGLARHKGYPTRAHRESVAAIGPCPIHRIGFGDIGTLL